jgi:hypothetical protein
MPGSKLFAACARAAIFLTMTAAAQAADRCRDINLLIEGQSNAGYFFPEGGKMLAADLQHRLGFDRKTHKISLLGSSNGLSVWGASSLIPAPWVAPSKTWLAGDAVAGWKDGALETQFLAYLHSLPAATKAAPTVTLWLHNENDSWNDAVTQADWESAIRYNVAEERQAFGQTGTTMPMDFVFVPFDFGPGMALRAGHAPHVQALKAGFEALAADPAFNAVIAAQAGDSNMNGPDSPKSGYGGLHFGPADITQLAGRLALTIAHQVADCAAPGSPEARARGQPAATGPRVIGAARGGAGQVVLSFPEATHLAPLSPGAAQGAGWVLVSGRTHLSARAATLSGNHLLLDFAQPVPTVPDARVYYGYGDGRIFAGDPKQMPDGSWYAGPGIGMAVYDSNGLPAWTPAIGVAIGRGDSSPYHTQ